MAPPTPAEVTQQVTLTLQAPIAIITINNPRKLNALTQAHYYRISCLLRDIAIDPSITITILTGTGRFFSAGADVSSARPAPPPPTSANATAPDARNEAYSARREIMSGFVANNLDATRSFYTHPKILIGALNGPAVGLSAALLGFCDFIYCTPHTYLLTPFSSLGLVSEGGASIGFVQRMGISLATETLLTSRKIGSDRLLHSGFVNKIFSGADEKDSDGFLKQVVEEVKERLGEHLNKDSLVGIKKLIRAPYLEQLEAQGVREVIAGMGVFEAGVPQKEFARIASGQKRHKL